MRSCLPLLLAGIGALFAFLTPAVLAVAGPVAPLFAQAGDTGISIPGLLGILIPVATAWASTVIYLARSKDDALKGQAEAHRAHIDKKDEDHRLERAGLHQMLSEERDRNERTEDARARDAAAARESISKMALRTMQVLDGGRFEGDPPTPDSPTPLPRESRPLIVPGPSPTDGGPLTRRGARRSNG